MNLNAHIGSSGASNVKGSAMSPNFAKTRRPAVTAITLILIAAAAHSLLSVPIVGDHIQHIIGNAQSTLRSYLDCRPDQSQDPYRVHTLTMRLLQLNCQSYNTTKHQIHQYVQDKNIHIICLSETWNTEDSFPFRNWNTHFKNRVSDPHGGVAMAIHPSIKMVKDPSLQNHTEVAWVKMFLNSKVVHLASVYIPPGRMDHIDSLSETLDSLPPDAPLILTGDFNACSPSWDNRTDIPRNTASFRVGRRLEELIAQHGLLIHNTGHYTHTKVNGTTGRVTKSAIDITISQNIGSEIQWSVDMLAPVRSDHLACVSNIQPLIPSPPIIRWDLKDVDWPSWEANMEVALQNWYDQMVGMSHDVNYLCETFTEVITSCANNHLPTKSVTKHSRPFFSPELKDLQSELRTANRNFRYRSDQANLAKLNDAKAKYNEAYTKASTRWWSKTLEKIDRKNLWKVVNKIKNSHTHIAVQPIRTANDEYVFQDEEIAAKLEEVHIHRSHAASSTFDDNWRDQVETELSRTIQI